MTASPSPASPADVADYRHRCARSGLHAHDGCTCTDADLIRRYAPVDAVGVSTPAMGALPSSDGSKAQPLGAVASSSADDVVGLPRKAPTIHADPADMAAFKRGWNAMHDEAAAALSRLQARLAEVTAERDNWQSRAAERDAECDKRAKAQWAAVASAATMREALNRAYNLIANTPFDGEVVEEATNILNEIVAALDGEQGK